MADASDVLMTTLDDFLLSLAEGIENAQAQLDQRGALGDAVTPGAPPSVRYCLPKVDFELRVMVDMVASTAISQKLGAALLRGPGTINHLVMRPVAPAETTDAGASVQIASTIRGSFVAVPVNAGRPPPQLRTTTKWIEPGRRAAISVLVTTTSGEPLAGTTVEINIDREQSIALSAAAGVSVAALRDDTRLDAGLLQTDANGTAAATLTISPGEVAGTRIALVTEAAGQSETVVFSAGGLLA